MAILTSFRPSKTHRVIVFGAPKSGKTELAGALSKYFKLLWFDFENGFETLLKLPKEQQERINLVKLPDSKVYPIAIETMLKVIGGNAVNICDQHGKVGCAICKRDNKEFTEVNLNTLDDSWIVVFDSITQLANSAMNHITKNQDEDYKFDWEDYRKQGMLMDKFLSQVQQARYNIVCITHEAEVEMEDGRKRLVPVAGTSNFSRNTAKYFDHVIYSEVKNRKHAFGSSTTYSNNILTGSRTNIVMESASVPTLLSIFKPDTIGTVANKDANTSSAGTVVEPIPGVNKTTAATSHSSPTSADVLNSISDKLAALKGGKK